MAVEGAVRGMEERLKALEEKLSPRLEDAKEKLADANAKAKGFIRENPALAIGGALALGFLIGRLASRR
ncbi:MAG: hypothetical protein K1X89_27955 [Myxococcaceae bacterium]|nr:hypothetical protein [Myxococcaceae bacterium]